MLILQIGAGLLAAGLLLLALPVELRFEVHGVEPPRGHIALRALFGLWRWRFAVPTPRHGGSGAATRTGDDTAQRPARRRTGGLDRVQALWSDVGLRRRAWSRLRAALDTVQCSELHLHVRLGLGDPADTGRLWALLGPLGALLASLRGADIAIEPDFVEPVLDLDAGGRLVLVPLRVMWPLVILAGSFGLAVARQRRWRAQRVT